MSTADTIGALTGFERRGAGTDAERRAALWLADQLRTAGREASVETFWCRPNWALAQAWHTALALAGSLVSVGDAKLGGALILVALLSLVLDALTGVSPGRRLSPEHASQNVVSASRADAPPTRLLITANYDAGRTGLAYRRGLREPFAVAHRLTGGRAPGWQGWLAIAYTWVLVIAILRYRGSAGTTLDVAQLIPAVSLVLALALLLELASAPFGPAAGDNASGVALALALARALEVSAPRQLKVEVVLQGAGDGAPIGLRRYLRGRRRGRSVHNTIVLGIAPCGGGEPRWWTSDGPLIPLRFARPLRRAAERVAAADPTTTARPHRGRGASPAFAARFAGLPAITIGCLDGDDRCPGSHLPTDLPQNVDPGSVGRLLEFALTLVDAIDASLAEGATGTAAASRTAA